VRALKSAGERLAQGAMELAAVDLNEAQHALAEITGDEADERLLDRVFSRFCVGK
jgi:tRNA modification GTPase